MAITKILNDHNVTLLFEEDDKIRPAIYGIFSNLNIEVTSFSGMLTLLNQQHPELASYIQVIFPNETELEKMAITFKLNDHRVSLNWKKDSHMRAAVSEDLANQNIEVNAAA